MSRLVIVSNRVADLRRSSQSGGLAVGLADALRERGGVWFGWDGETFNTQPGDAKIDQVDNVRMISASMTVEDYGRYYIGYANSVLWPLFHYRLDLVDYRPAYFSGYLHVNARFASILARYLEDDDLVWVHDYHFIPMAEFLRSCGCRQRIGFFLHIPFPPPDLLAASPNHRRLVEALLEYDVVGFQTSTDAANLRRYLEEWDLGEMIDEHTLVYEGRRITLNHYPIGIDVDTFARMANDEAKEVRVDATRRSALGRRQIIGVDRLDYSKGLPDRFQAFERLLTRFPEHERRVTFVQIAPPTRENVNAYADIRAELEGLAGSINGRFSDFNWTPLRYIHRSVPRETLAALFRFSHVGLVTPLRDGMNLVAKEFVAAQDEDDPGVLVLSQFAGAAEELKEALIVNPYDVHSMAETIHEALTMPLADRRRRHEALLKRIRAQDAHAWMRSFLTDLERAKPLIGSGTAASAA